MQVSFWHADKRQSFRKLVLSFLVEVARRNQNTQNRKMGIFLQYIKKIVATALCSIVMQNIQIFYMDPVMFVVTCFSLYAGLLSNSFLMLLGFSKFHYIFLAIFHLLSKWHTFRLIKVSSICPQFRKEYAESSIF